MKNSSHKPWKKEAMIFITLLLVLLGLIGVAWTIDGMQYGLW